MESSVGEFMNVSEFLEELGGRISKNTVYNAINRGEIPCVFMGRRRLIPRDALQRMLKVPSNTRWATPKNSQSQAYDVYWHGRSKPVPVAVPHDE